MNSTASNCATGRQRWSRVLPLARSVCLAATMCWTLGVVAVAMAQAPPTAGRVLTPSQQSALFEGVGRLLEMGIPAEGRGDVKAATRQHSQLTAQFGQRDEADYAYSLVLLRHERPKQAVPLVAKVSRGGLALASGAHQTHVMALVQDKQYAKAAAALSAYAAALGEHPRGDDQSSLDAAIWLGQVAGFVSGPVRDKGEWSPLRRACEEIAGSLPPALKAAYEDGRSAVLESHAAMREELSGRGKVVAKVADEKRAQDLEQLFSRRDEAQGRQTEVTKKKTELEAEYRKWKADFVQNRLSPLNRMLAQHAMKREIVAQRVLILQNNRGLIPLESGLTPWRVQEEIDQLDVEKRKLEFLVQAALAEMTRRSREYQLASGTLGAEEQELAKLQSQLKKMSEQRKELALPAERGQKSREKASTSIQSYVSFDLTQQRDRLLELIGQKPAASPEKAERP